MVWRTLRYDTIEELKRSRTDHGLPDKLHSLSCEFDERGNLVDIEAYDEDGQHTACCGLALPALVDECQRSGDESN